ncbi:MAG: hypothetical protein N3A61_04095 [Ignavibacteria bacterium]|nr:hypothetical protein [Ignavibacteria bacterium]
MQEKNKFKYDMNLYYQSVVIYTLALVIYVLVRAQFVGFDYNKILRDPIFTFFLFVIVITVVTTIYNQAKKKYLEISDDGFTVSNWSSKKHYNFDDIISIKIIREHRFHFQGVFRTIKIRLKNRVAPILIRPFDYEDGEMILAEFRKLREKLELNQLKQRESNV